MMMMGRVRCARAHLPLPHTWLRLNLLVAQLNRGISHRSDRRLETQTLSYPQWSDLCHTSAEVFEAFI